MLPAQKILEVAANGTTTWEFPMVQFGEPSNDKAGRVFLDGWDVHLRRNRAGTVGEFN